MQIGFDYLLHKLQLHLIIHGHRLEIHPPFLLQLLRQPTHHPIEISLGEEIGSVAGYRMSLHEWVQPGLKYVWANIEQLWQNS